MPHNIGWLRSTVGGTPVWLANCPCLRSACSRRVTTMWVNRLLQVSKLGNSAFHPSRVDKRVAGLFIGCVLRWHHLVNACEVKAHLIRCWQNFGAVCFWQPIPSGLNLVVAAVLHDSLCVVSLLSCVADCCML